MYISRWKEGQVYIYYKTTCIKNNHVCILPATGYICWQDQLFSLLNSLTIHTVPANTPCSDHQYINCRFTVVLEEQSSLTGTLCTNEFIHSSRMVSLIIAPLARGTWICNLTKWNGGKNKLKAARSFFQGERSSCSSMFYERRSFAADLNDFNKSSHIETAFFCENKSRLFKNFFLSRLWYQTFCGQG